MGKSLLTRSLAEALQVPWTLIDSTMLSEQNWAGTDVSAYLRGLYSAHGAAAASRAVVVLDEIDKICVGGMEQSSKDYRLGKQQSLLPLCGTGSEIPLGAGLSCQPDQMIVIAAGVFDGLAPGKVGPGDLMRLGRIHEFVERLGSIIRLEPLQVPHLIHVIRSAMKTSTQTFRSFGSSGAIV